MVEASLTGRFWQGELPVSEGRQVVAALLAGDRSALPTAGTFLRHHESDAARLDQTFGRVSAQVRHAMRSRAGHDATTLDSDVLAAAGHDAPVDRLLTLLASCDSDACDALLAASYRLRFEDAPRSWRLAEAARVLASELCAQHDDPPSRERLGRAWSELGRARRIVSDLTGAQEALTRAQEALRQGLGDPLAESLLWERWALLRWDQGNSRGAHAAIDRSIRICRELHDDHLVGCALINKAQFSSQDGDATAAIALLSRASRLIDAQREPRAVHAVLHNLAVHLLDAGREQDAAQHLPALRRLVDEVGSRDDRVDHVWLEGKVALATQHPWAAAEHLALARQQIVGRENAIDLGIVTLELAVAQAMLGEVATARELGFEAEGILRAAGLELEATAARLLAGSTGELQATLQDLLVQVVAWSRQPGSAGR
jgi:tetratricopeptide (TPR) repeat protein